MKIELLYTETCPHYKESLKILNKILNELSVEENIEMINIRNQKDADDNNFSGSPTVRINGNDVDPQFKNSGDYGFRCRVYFYSGTLYPHPPEEMVRNAIREIRKGR